MAKANRYANRINKAGSVWFLRTAGLRSAEAMANFFLESRKSIVSKNSCHCCACSNCFDARAERLDVSTADRVRLRDDGTIELRPRRGSIDRIREILAYDGPSASVEDMDEAIAGGATDKWKPSIPTS